MNIEKKLRFIIIDLRILENLNIDDINRENTGFLPKMISLTQEELKSEELNDKLVDKFLEERGKFHFIFVTSTTDTFSKFESSFYKVNLSEEDKLKSLYGIVEQKKVDKQLDLNAENLSTRDNYYLNRKKKRNMFKVIITRKKIAGRKRKKDKEEEEEENINIHSKKSRDNIIRKIKVHSFKFAKNLINNCIKHEFGKKRIKIRSIKGELISDITINFNIEFFNSTLERIFSNPLNQKYKNKDLNQNIIEIRKIRQSKEAKLTNELLDTTFNDIYDMFINYEKKENENKFIKYGKKCNTLKEFLLLEKKKKVMIKSILMN